MEGRTEIANDALALINVEPLTGWTQQSLEGDAVRRHYPKTVAALLEDYPWSFAERRKVLVEMADGSDDPFYSYAYQRPSDAIVVRRLAPTTALLTIGQIAHREAFQGSEPVIYANVSPVACWYTSGETSEAVFTPRFKDYVAAELAIRLNLDLRTSRSTVRDLVGLRDERKMQAQATDHKRRVYNPMEETSSFEDARK